MPTPRRHPSAEAYDPFEDTGGPVGVSPYFHVERVPGGTAGEPARFRKALRPGAPDELLAMIHRENMLLMDMGARRVPGVAQTLSFSRSASDAAFEVTTLDAGPSLDLWRRRAFVVPAAPLARAAPWLTPRLAMQLLRRLLQVLRDVHAHGYVHADLHAGNVCLPFDRDPADPRAVRPRLAGLRLIDFGHTLHPRLRFDEPLRMDPDAPESLRRVSPALREALRRDAAAGRATHVFALDARVDLHALGALAATWLESLDWSAEPRAAAWFPVLATCVDRLRALDSRPQGGIAGVHDDVSRPLDAALGAHADEPGPWRIPGPPVAGPRDRGGGEVARETPLALPARPAPPRADDAADVPMPPRPVTAAAASGASAPAARRRVPRSVRGPALGLGVAAVAAIAAWSWRADPGGVASQEDASPPAVAQRATGADRHLADMVRHAAAGRWSAVDAAAAAIPAVRDPQPPTGIAAAALGTALPDIEAGAYGAAAATLRDAADRGAGHWRVWSALGYAALREGRLDEAERALWRSLRANPADASAWAHLGELEAMRGDGERALAMLRLSVRHSTQRERTLAHLRAGAGSRIAPAFQDVVRRAGAGLDRVPSRSP